MKFRSSESSELPIFRYELPIFRTFESYNPLIFARARPALGDLLPNRTHQRNPRALLAPKSRQTTSSIDFWTPFGPLGKRPKKHHFPEPSKIDEVGPNVAFLQGKVLFFEHTFVDSVTKMMILGSPSKSTFFQKGALEGPGSAKKL